MEVELLKYLLFATVAILVFRYFSRRQVQDAKALYYATVAEPIIIMSESPFDEGVTERAEEARQLLEKHGNTYLNKATDVWTLLYSADLTKGAANEHLTRNFSLWREWRYQENLKALEAWREAKLRANRPAAETMFTGQRHTNS